MEWRSEQHDEGQSDETDRAAQHCRTRQVSLPAGDGLLRVNGAGIQVVTPQCVCVENEGCPLLLDRGGTRFLQDSVNCGLALQRVNVCMLMPA